MLGVCPSLAVLTLNALRLTTPPACNIDPTLAPRADLGAPVASMARVYADVNQNMPRSYWDYDSVNIGMRIVAQTIRPAQVSNHLLTFGRRLGRPGELRGR